MIAALSDTNLLNEYRINGLFANAHIFLAAVMITLVVGALMLTQRGKGAGDDNSGLVASDKGPVA